MREGWVMGGAADALRRLGARGDYLSDPAWLRDFERVAEGGLSGISSSTTSSYRRPTISSNRFLTPRSSWRRWPTPPMSRPWSTPPAGRENRAGRVHLGFPRAGNDAWARAKLGDVDASIPVIRDAVDRMFETGQLAWGIAASGILVETLLMRGTDRDVREAEAAIDRLAETVVDDLLVRDVWLLWLRALLARAQGDEAGYRDYRDQYRDMARTFGFEGHIAWAEAMP